MKLKWRVRELAEQQGITARELAAKTGLDEKTVRNIMSGRATRVDLRTIEKLSDALGVHPGPLWQEEDRWAAWDRTSGSARHASREEFERILAGGWDDLPDPALERATRDIPWRDLPPEK